MTSDIFAFVHDKLLRSGDYKSKMFGTLEAFAKEAEKMADGIDHKTKPGKHSPDVSNKNKGETAFQRALYSHSEGQIQSGKVSWCDIELPVTLSKKSRRRCVDLIGRFGGSGYFLCELKYANPKSKSRPSSKSPDYAVLEALLYYGCVKKNQRDLDKQMVWREERKAEFFWADVAKSKTIMVLANEKFWIPAQPKRLSDLINSIEGELNVKVLLYKTPCFQFKEDAADKPGRYCPKLPDGADKWTPVFESTPTENA